MKLGPMTMGTLVRHFVGEPVRDHLFGVKLAEVVCGGCGVAPFVARSMAGSEIVVALMPHLKCVGVAREPGEEG